MSKKILGSLGILAGLGLALFLGYRFLSESPALKPSASNPTGTFQGVIRPTPESPQKPAPLPAASPEPAPAAPGPAAPPALTPPLPPGPPQAEAAAPPLTPLAPREEPGLLAGKYRRYADAKSLLAKIQKRKLPAFIRKEGRRYQVWVGPFGTPEEMARAKKNLQTALKISPRAEQFEVPVPK
jgi:cell division protein FtsN